MGCGFELANFLENEIGSRELHGGVGLISSILYNSLQL